MRNYIVYKEIVVNLSNDELERKIKEYENEVIFE